jgi:hypothetical protein
MHCATNGVPDINCCCCPCDVVATAPNRADIKNFDLLFTDEDVFT